MASGVIACLLAGLLPSAALAAPAPPPDRRAPTPTRADTTVKQRILESVATGETLPEPGTAGGKKHGGPAAGTAAALSKVSRNADQGSTVAAPHYTYARSISGQVTGGGSGLSGVGVYVVSPEGRLINNVGTGPGGTYSITVPAGSWYLQFHDGTNTYGTGYRGSAGFTYDWAAAAPVSVTTADVTGVNVALPNAVHISGTITAINGGAASIVATAYDKATGDWAGSTMVGSTGSYSIAVAPGGNYVLNLMPFDGFYPVGYWSPSGLVAGVAGAGTITVGAADHGGVDLAMPIGRLVSGTVTRPGGSGEEGIEVDAWDSTTLELAGITMTDATGAYSLSVFSGSYYIEFADASRDYATGYWRGPGFTDEFHLASAVTVSTSDVSGISVQLPASYRVSGTVTNASSLPLSLIKVRFYDATDGWLVASTVSDTSGAYSVALEPGSYYVVFSDSVGVYCTAYWNGSGLSLDLDDGKPLSVSSPVTLNAQMTVTGTLPSRYYAVAPTRLLDTRDGTGGLSGPFTNHVSRGFQVAGRGGVPSDAVAVTGNLTVTGQTSKGYLFVGPSQTNDPTSSTLNFPMGDDRANGVTVALGSDGKLWVTFVAPSNGPTAHAIFDVTGYFRADDAGATYHAVAPTRLLDTRDGTGGLSGPFTNHASRVFPVAGRGGIPANAVAVTGNLTVTGQTSKGYLFVGPNQANDPTSSTLNFPVGDDRANGVTVALGSGGVLWVTFVAPTSGPSAQAIFDVTGYFTMDSTGATYVAVTPSRLLDSRDGTGGLSTPFTNHTSRWFYATSRGGVPADAVAVTGNLTVTAQSSKGYLFVGPAQANAPTSSTLNFPVADDRANGVTVALGAQGELWVTFVAPSDGPTAHGIFDVTGYFEQ